METLRVDRYCPDFVPQFGVNPKIAPRHDGDHVVGVSVVTDAVGDQQSSRVQVIGGVHFRGRGYQVVSAHGTNLGP